MDCIVCGIAESWTQLSNFHFYLVIYKKAHSHLNGA